MDTTASLDSEKWENGVLKVVERIFIITTYNCSNQSLYSKINKY